MASRSNTALQAAVILLIILVAVLGVTTYVFYAKQDAAYNDLQKAEQERDTARNNSYNQDFAFKLMKRVLGLSTIAAVDVENMRNDLKNRAPELSKEVEAIESKFQQDMRLFPAGHADAKDYTTLPVTLWETIQDLNQKLTDEQKRVAQLTKEKDDILTRESARADAAEKARDDALAAKTAAESAFAAERARLVKQNDDLAKQLASKGTDIKTMFDKATAEKNDLVNQISKLQQTVEFQRKKLDEMTSTSFDQPDGRVVRANQSAGIVWIDLGTADGLRRQQTFAIYDKDEGDFQNATPKGTIEITSVDQPNMAQARIVSDDITDPILPEDVVFSPTWQPGQRLHFALAGTLDYNEDGQSDNRLVKNVIGVNGGIIDAEVDEQGRRTGTVSIQTRYLVVGNRPSEKSDAAVTNAYTNLIGQADELGIEKISVQKLLEMMGHRPEARTQTLGRGGGSAPSGSAAPRFRSRNPGSAYE
ncbi:MAG: hypothetical protein RIC55_18985 [Pirellulaceae bacterium]